MQSASLLHFDRCYDEAQTKEQERKKVNLEAMLQKMPKRMPKPAPFRHQVTDIQEAVCARFQIKYDDLVSQCRREIYTKPRQIAMFLARDITGMSFPKLGRRFGGKDHTSVMHACRQVQRRLATDPDIALIVEEIRAEVSA